MVKKMNCFRLSEDTLKKIDVLCRELGNDKTCLIENAVSYYYKQYVWQIKEGSILPFSNVNLNKLFVYLDNFENEKSKK